MKKAGLSKIKVLTYLIRNHDIGVNHDTPKKRSGNVVYDVVVDSTYRNN